MSKQLFLVQGQYFISHYMSDETSMESFSRLVEAEDEEGAEILIFKEMKRWSSPYGKNYALDNIKAYPVLTGYYTVTDLEEYLREKRFMIG